MTLSDFPRGSDKVRKSLRYGILDGSANAASLGLGQEYVTPFALALKATTAQIGLLSSLSSLVMALSQLLAPQLAERAGSRKRFILRVVFIHALLWVPILLIPHVFPGPKVWWLVGFFTLSVVFGSLGNPAWGSMMSDLVPAGMRGRYFGLRGRICGFTTLVFFFIGGVILRFSATEIFFGFSIIFGAAVLFRLMSWYFISKMYEPPLRLEWWERRGLLDIVSSLTSSNLGRFTIYVSLMNFATYIAGPFLAVYMLRDLRFDYLTYAAVIVSASLVHLTFLTFWGRRADSLGNVKVLSVTSILIPLVPLLWVASHQLYWLIPVQMLSGFAWSGFTLASTNFVYDASTPENRMRCIALFNAMNGGAMCFGAILGGYLALYLPPVLGYSLLTLFLISGLLRGLVAVTLLRHVSEVRPGVRGWRR
ncbi:MAG: MFS transporter [Chloroflexi bacterium]|nr:MFS transporter [Chloroflexota bacterium]